MCFLPSFGCEYALYHLNIPFWHVASLSSYISTCVNHHEALNSLVPGLVPPHDLPGSNIDGDVWLMSLLLLGFGRLKPQLGRLEPARRHMYLLADQGIGHPRQSTWWIGYWSLRHGGWWHDDWCSHYMQDVVFDLLC